MSELRRMIFPWDQVSDEALRAVAQDLGSHAHHRNDMLVFLRGLEERLNTPETEEATASSSGSNQCLYISLH